MKIISIKQLIVSFALTGFIFSLTGCKKINDLVLSPQISKFSPESGLEGATVIISGSHFGNTPAFVQVSFNDVVADISASTDTSLTVTVPTGATTGKIKVIVSGRVATSMTDFIVSQKPVPSITSLSPAYGQTGITVIISGINFGSSIGDNTVKFNGTMAVISAASSTQLTVVVPNGATSGKVSVTVDGVTGSSVADFLVGCPDLIISNMSISNIVGNNFKVTYDIKNIGAVPMTMTTMFIQSYVSKDGIELSVASGGFGDYGSSEPMLQPNQVRQKTQDISDPDMETYPYVIFVLKSSAQVDPPECNLSNNTSSKKIN